MTLQNITSRRRPAKNPTNSPSFFPRIKPNEATTTIRRLGEIEAMANALNTVHCKRKQTMIVIARTIFLLIVYSPPCSFVVSVEMSFVCKITNTSSRCSKSTIVAICPDFGQIVGIRFYICNISNGDSFQNISLILDVTI